MKIGEKTKIKTYENLIAIMTKVEKTEKKI